MIKHPRKPGHNVVSMPAPARDPIEDEHGRTALITLAERLVSYDWVRKAHAAPKSLPIH